MSPGELMDRVDALLSHVWMVRTFVKHSEEAQEDEDLAETQRVLYDYMLALGPVLQAGDATAYLNQARKKLAKLRAATQRFSEIQPEVSTHTNFVMAARSLSTAVDEIAQLLGPRDDA